MSDQPTATAAGCTKGGTPHLLRDHGTDGHEHAHNPWSEHCTRRLRVEPFCPDARCMTCDGARRGRPWVAPRIGGYQARHTGRPKPPPPPGKGIAKCLIRPLQLPRRSQAESKPSAALARGSR